MKQFGDYDNIFVFGEEKKDTTENVNKCNDPLIKTQIEVKCFKWLGSFVKDKYADFFDYESKSFYLRDYKINTQGTIIDYYKVFQFKNNEVHYQHSSDLFSEAHLFIQDNIVVSQLPSILNQSNYILHYNPYAFIVCKYLEQSNPILILKENDVIKIGKYSIEVKYIQIGVIKENKPLIEDNKEESIHSNDNDEIVCRICFRGGKDNNTFVSPCNCRGSLQYYHPDCLIRWIQSKLEIKFEYVNPFCYYIHLKNFKCEICKCAFPFYCITNTNKVVYLVEELEKKKNIMIIKTSHLMKSTESDILCPYEEYVMLDFSNRYKKEISVGRGRTSLYQLNDISLSRNHCLFILDNGDIRIKDCQSKFGTLIKMREDIILSKDNVTMTLQKGNSAYHFVYQII